MPDPLRFLSPIHRASRQIGIHLAAQVSSLGLQTVEAHLLSFLRTYAPCPIAEIRRVFGLKGSTLTSMLDRLEERALIAREPTPGDRRSVRIRLTDIGVRVAGEVQRPVEELERRIRAEVEEQDLRGFDRVMEAIARVTGVQVRKETR